MSQARSMLQVRGLDCPERGRVAPRGPARSGGDHRPGVRPDPRDDDGGLRRRASSIPSGLARLITERTGMQATVQGEARGIGGAADSWWSRYGHWVLTAGSGLALAAGAGVLLAGAGDGLEHDGRGPAGRRRLMRSRSSIGGVGLFPRAARNLLRLHLDIDVLMGLAILGAMALGQWDEAATVAFLYGLSEALEALSLDRARRSIRALLDLAPPTAERIGADGTIEVVPAGQVRGGRSRAGARRRHDPGRRRGGLGPVERRPEDDHRRVGPGGARSRATRSTPGRSTARGRWRSGPRARWATP